jgi:hypothetical protein
MHDAEPGRTSEQSWASFVARHERRLIVLWLAGCALLLAVMGLWGIVWNGAERAVDASSDRWVAALDRAQAMFERGELHAAQSALERLDASCPALFVKHRLDKERERQLTLLGNTYVALDRRAKARATFQRLVGFDARNFANHFARAEALRTFGDAEARAAYESVLAIHPTHLPSVAALMDMAFDTSDYARVVEVFDAYVEAWTLARIAVRCADVVTPFEVPVDGSLHDHEALLELPAGWSGPVALETRGFSATLERMEFEAPLRAGVPGRPEGVVLAPGADWVARSARTKDGGLLVASALDSSWTAPAVPLPHGAARLRLTLRLHLTVTSEMWTQASKSYANCLLHARWREVSSRAVLGGAPEAGSEFRDE